MQNKQDPAAETYDTSALKDTPDIAEIAVNSIVTAKAKLGDPTSQLVKLRIMQEQLATQKKARNKEGSNKPALFTMDDIAQSMVDMELKTRLGV